MVFWRSLKVDLEKFKKQCGKIFIYQSKDDPLVSQADFEKYQKALPDATARIFKNRGHFNQPTFPELVKGIKDLEGVKEISFKKGV